METIKVEVEDEYLGFEGSCFICLQPTSANQEKILVNLLFKYLEIKDKVEPICEKCGDKLAKFGKLLGILEKVRLEMDYLLGFIQSAIFNSNKDCQSRSTRFNSARECLAKKCGKQIRNPKAEIILQRIDLSNPVKMENQTLSYDCSDDWSTNGEDNFDFNLNTTDPHENPSTPVINEIRCVKAEGNLTNSFTTCAQPRRSKSKTNSKSNPFKCSTCLKSFRQKKNLLRHIDTVHLHIKPYKCDVCDKSFASATTLKAHKVIPHKPKREAIPNAETFNCETCGKAFDKWRTLTLHKRRVHAERRFKCDLCKNTFKRSTHLNIHISSIHKNERFYCQAPGCDKSYTRPAALVVHYKLEHPDVPVPQKPSTNDDIDDCILP